MELYESLRDDTAARLIEKFGKPVKLTRAAVRSFDETAGKYTDIPGNLPTNKDTFALRIGAVAVLKGTGEWRDGMVLSWNEGLLVSAANLGGFEPVPTDTVLFNGKQCPIMKIIAVKPGDVAIAYKIGIVVK